MTDSTSYVSVAEVRAYAKDTGNLHETIYQDAIESAQRQIDGLCGRFFYKTTTATAKYYWPDSTNAVCVDDFWTTTNLTVEVDSAGDGTYSQSWTLNTDFYLEPINQSSGGITGWPYEKLCATSVNKYFPLRATHLYTRPTVKVTAQWGWADIPAQVKQATKIAASKQCAMSGTPLGFIASPEVGAIRVRDIPEVMSLLGPFLQDEYAVA